MSHRKHRKRKRSQVFPDGNGRDELDEETILVEDDEEDNRIHAAKSLRGLLNSRGVTTSANPNQAMAEDADMDAKKQELWETFREENYEALEQLPLSLHRAYALILELDEQVNQHTDTLVPSLRRYIALRKSLIVRDKPQLHLPTLQVNIMTRTDSDLQILPFHHIDQHSQESLKTPIRLGSLVDAPEVHTTHSNPQLSASSVHRSSSISPLTEDTRVEAIAATSLHSTRELLTTIAHKSEEIIRASNEKVNLSRFAYDLVNRYVRDLDRSLKEAETSFSVGLRPGTHPASIILPELVIPKPIRVVRQYDHGSILHGSSEMLNHFGIVEVEGSALGAGSELAPSLEAPAADISSVIPISRRKNRGNKWSRKKSHQEKDSELTLDASMLAENLQKERPALKLTLPPLSLVTNTPSSVPKLHTGTIIGDDTKPETIPVGEEENWVSDDVRPYCYCGDVSYGSMVGCDNPNCPREWCHLGCVGLTELPASDEPWYCPDCLPEDQGGAQKNGKKRRRKRR